MILAPMIKLLGDQSHHISSSAQSAESSTSYAKRNTCIAILILSLMMILFAVSTASASPSTPSAAFAGGPTDKAELESFMDGAVNAILTAHHIPGATVALVKGDRMIFAKGYGYADIEKRLPVVANQTLFRIGSVSKLFIWTAIMQLSEEGKVDLDADINIYLKEFQIPATYSKPITLKNLMTHTPGFEDLATDGRIFVNNSSDIVPLGKYLKDRMPARIRPPGEVTAYSNYGSALAAYIVAQVSGMSYDKYVEENILLPLGMKNTTFEQPLPPALLKNMSQGYTYANGDFVEVPFEVVQIWPAGSVSSTSVDMAKFMIAHLQNGRYGYERILKESTAKEMHSQLFTNDPKVSGWTYGFYQMDLNHQDIIMHGGDTLQFHTFLVLLPESDLGLFISCNERFSEPAIGELLTAFMDHYYPIAPPPLPDAISGFGQNASLFAGSYRTTRSAYTNYEKAGVLFQEAQVSSGLNNTLTITGISQDANRWVEVAPLVFRPASGLPASEELVFGGDGQGNIDHIFMKNNPTTAYERVDWKEGANFNYALLAVSTILFLSTLIWAMGWIFNRCPRNSNRFARLARWSVAAASMLDLLFLMGLVIVSSIDQLGLIYGIPSSLKDLLTITLIAAFLALASSGFVILAWKNSYWSLPARIHYTLVTLALLAFIWWLNNWNLLGYKF
jgi:CubicO group peptidase (beta-lactamase class C family)